MRFLDDCFSSRATPVEFETQLLKQMVVISEAKLHGQHVGLVKILTRLYRAVSRIQVEGVTDRDPLLIEKILKGLCVYTETHFKDEEKYLKQIKFKGYKKHRKLHKAFVSTIRVYWKDVKSGETADPSFYVDVLFYTTYWLLHHINRQDVKYINNL